MKTNFKIIILTIIAALCVESTWAGEKSDTVSDSKFSCSVGGDVVSGYVWRGQNCGGVSFQPAFSVDAYGFSLGAWGSVGIDAADTKEFDITLGYSLGGFSASVTDYWFAYPTKTNHYFHYDPDTTAHVFEAQIGYDFGLMAFNWYTNFAGADGIKEDGDVAYSSYFSVAAPFDFGGLVWEAELGFVPWKTSYYADVDSFAFTNVSLKATKSLKVSEDFILGMYAQTVWNPTTEGAYMVLGFNL